MSVTVAEFVQRRNHTTTAAPAVVLPLPGTLMGVEVEVDNDGSHDDISLPDNYSPEWSRKHDGSLSNGYEYVLAAPLKGQGLVDAVYKLYESPTTVYRTYTGSTHIHVNMMDGVSVDALRTMVLLSYAFESLLYYVGDNTRQWCGYANRLTSAPSEVLESIINGSDGSRFLRATSDAGRYYGLNLTALNKYGTVEFRYFPTAESAEELLGWIKLVQNFKRASIEIGSMEALITTLSTKEGYTTFISEYFPDNLDEVLASCEYKKVKALMSKALIIATAAKPSTYRTWDTNKIKDRYSKLITISNSAGTKFNLYVTLSGSPAPSAVLARQDDIHTLGEDSITLLLHTNGELYYAMHADWSSSAYDWLALHNMPEYGRSLVPVFATISDAVVARAQACLPAGIRDRFSSVVNSILASSANPAWQQDYEESEMDWDEADDEDEEEDN